MVVLAGAAWSSSKQTLFVTCGGGLVYKYMSKFSLTLMQSNSHNSEAAVHGPGSKY